MYEHTYEAPSLERFGSIETLTGIFDKCYDVIPGAEEKGVGYESDTSYKFIPLCDLDGNDPVSGL